MVSWEDRDINRPELYAPRPYPRVQKAAMPLQEEVGQESSLQEGYVPAGIQAAREPDIDFVFDEDPVWNRKLSDVDIVQTERTAPRPGRHQPARQNENRRKPAGRSAEKAASGKPAQRKSIFANLFTKRVKPPRSAEGSIKGRPYLYAGIIAGCVVLLALIIIMMMPQIAGYFWKDLGNYAFINGELLRYDKAIVDTYKQYREYMQQDIIFPGIFVDGTHIGGMTVEEARQVLTSEGSATDGAFSVTVAIGNKTWTFDNSNIPATRDLGNVLEKAYAIGRSNTTAIIGTKMTPFRERVDTALALREGYVYLQAQAAYDQEAVRALVDEIVHYVTREPVDAQIQSFDFATRTFGFTDEQVGVTVDGDALYEKITASLEQWEKGTTLTVEPVLAQPNVTKAQLMASFKLVAAYTTDTTGEASRNNNISLASQAINGTVLMPGETFSFNGATGERTISKGYQEAGAIAGGQTIDEVGGGICQVSSTLFNAVARADLEIVNRSPHAWPSTYVNRGEDATVNWPNLDFKFKNNKSTPIFVIAYYKDRKMSAEIWGTTLGDGVTIDLYSEIVKTTEPSSDTNYVYNAALPYGSEKETVKARTGYVVDTYKVWYQNGQETKREKMHTSTYKTYQRTVEYNH